MQDLIGITVAVVVIVGGIFLIWTVFCLLVKGMFKIADFIFGE